MNFQLTLKQAGKAVKTVSIPFSGDAPILLEGDLAVPGSPFPARHPLVGRFDGKPLDHPVKDGVQIETDPLDFHFARLNF